MSIQKKVLKLSFKKLLFIIFAFLFFIVGTIFSIFYWQKIRKMPSTPPPTPTAFIQDKNFLNPQEIKIEKIDIIPQVPPYSLPLALEKIANYQDFSQKIKLSQRALSLLQKNGFVVIPTPKEIGDKEVFLFSSRKTARPKDDFVAFYEVLKEKDLPIFITTDSLLHYYHIFFNTTLMKLEKEVFYDDLWQISKELLEDAISQYQNSSGNLKEAAKRNVAYFSVGLELLKPKPKQIATPENIKNEIKCYAPEEYCNEFISTQLKEGKIFGYFTQEEAKKYSFEVPNFVEELVKKEIELIENHEGWKHSPIFVYKEDYSQYVPRGHYSRSEKLKNYFKAMMWYGRMTALIKGSPYLKKGESECSGLVDGIISEYDAKIQTLQASLITKKFLESKNLQERWKRIYAITSFFVGFSDDLGPQEYANVLKDLFQENLIPKKFEENYQEIKEALLKIPYNPKIYGGLGACQLFMPCPPLSDEEIQKLKTQAKSLLEATKGFRLMGQRFTLDSWLFSEIVSPYSGEYIGPKPPLPTDRKPFTFTWNDEFPKEKENRPFTWVKTDVRGCPPPATREVRGFPRGLDLMALLGSKRAKEILEELGDTQYSDYEKKFEELKKEIDSLSPSEWFKNLYSNWLYVLKALFQEFGKGYPTFMQTKAWQDKNLNTALASWAQLRHDTILYVKQSYTMAELGGGPPPKIVGYVEPVPEFYSRLLNLAKMTKEGLEKLVPQEILEKIKVGPALDEFSQILEKLLEISKKELENQSLSDEEYDFIGSFGKISEQLISFIAEGETESDILKTTIVADVHTEGNTEKVLEEGVGFIKTLIVAYKLPEGHILLGVGPVFSYYEFKQPMNERLTDEAWRDILNTNPPPEPEWIKSFSE